MCKTEAHNFYCLNCGILSYPLQRKCGKRKEKFHRKKLYCPHCKNTLNHIECRNYEEEIEFKILFNENYFLLESQEEMRIYGGKN